MNKSALDLTTWNRREHYEFFSGFDEPFFGIVSTVDFTIGYQKIKDNGYPYFLYYLHKALKAANHVTPFRYRIEEDKVYVYESIHASATIGREDHTFGFSFIMFDEDFKSFSINAQKEIEAVRNSTGLRNNDNAKRMDSLHISSIPWYNFSSISHARHFQYRDSVPKISFGKYTKEGSKINLPISIHVHHALMDGYHVGLYLEEFQRLLNEDA
ncbi:chloramphenicol acetyltransferase [Aquimarina sp. BL5]|uniref:chloramphenicol acetyltransferase n=1 Tax=Aquimarina sp. BL5 TaxID=1714860 RepID=UPI000E53512A|nr:chloramphenicol acetyltransferase [Aquimarina sp. BL5]AXT49614.1 chloramphenicol acetyltransferase [Aquimarina sp. BL5]RKN05437.1 chloramphenicol acetyltransferase [Aquimarina sp. BL5]